MTLDKVLFLKKQLENMFNVRIHVCVNVKSGFVCIHFLHKLPSVEENCIEI